MGTELNITAMVGMTMASGIVTEVGIFYCSEQQAVEAGRSRHDWLVLAGQHRMRAHCDDDGGCHSDLAPADVRDRAGLRDAGAVGDRLISGWVVQRPLVLLAMPALHALMRRGRSTLAVCAAKPT